MVVMPNATTPSVELTSYRFGPVSLIAASLSGRASRSRGQRSGVASGGEGAAQPVEHGLLAVADLLGTEAHEPAVLGRVGGGLGGREEPTSESRGLLRCGACGDQGLHCLEFVDDLVSRRSGAAGLVTLERVVALLGQRLKLQGDLGDQLLTARRGRSVAAGAEKVPCS